MAPARGVLLAALLVGSGAANLGEDEAWPSTSKTAWAEDDGCAEDSEECTALSLRQLRASAVKRHVAEEAAAAVANAPANVENFAEKSDPEEEDNANGLPGGWGEAAAEVENRHSDASLHPYASPANLADPFEWQHPTGPLPATEYHGQVLTLYHATSPEAGQAILQSGFRAGTGGWCGGGIYFAMDPAATKHKAIGPHSHQGFMLEAQVDVGRVKLYGRTCTRGIGGMNAKKLKDMGYDSVRFNPGDGDEVIVYWASRVIAVRQYRQR